MSLEIEASLTKLTSCGHLRTGNRIDARTSPRAWDAVSQQSHSTGTPHSEGMQPRFSH